MQPVWDAWNARTPEQQAADSITYNERLVQRFERLTDDQLARMHLNLKVETRADPEYLASKEDTL